MSKRPLTHFPGVYAHEPLRLAFAAADISFVVRVSGMATNPGVAPGSNRLSQSGACRCGAARGSAETVRQSSLVDSFGGSAPADRTLSGQVREPPPGGRPLG